ncbi:hypothetical protein I8J29_29295 [Paenibacillus sp. MWE-103]|uniref:Uncharacterized protein n=1 Tax=Paenibacillus artemisiicola TaxID=1172618 RepID=A0ABS3WIZ8_9BACL|nr:MULTISPECIES: hypothetical protein [Paenibacillus]MBO7748287.1 hypothetical protein [Paenibacillus artemisiicola]SFI73568.1 hypothetical protein SAMN02799624_01941 [Paenibacillus sp. UNC496MF]
MPGEHPSHLQRAASRAQSKADRGGGQGKEAASKAQSDADRAAVPKHGL